MTDLYPTRLETEVMTDRLDPVVYSFDQKGKEDSLSNEELKYYEENGFIFFPDFFSQEEVELLKAAYESLKEDKTLHEKEEFISEPDSQEVRSIFNPHQFHEVFETFSRDKRILEKVEQILGSQVYIHHARINIKPAYTGKSFPWHSDFETWHAEDGLAHMRTLTGWVMLTDNNEFNGPLYVIPGSHKTFVGCKGLTPKGNYKHSLKKQEYGVPSLESIKRLSHEHPLISVKGKAGTLVLHESNILHASPDNISPYDRTNLFFVYNSVENAPRKPFAAKESRASFLCNKDTTPLTYS